jgi:5-methylcytosine-specific restriction endonuclease McrA
VLWAQEAQDLHEAAVSSKAHERFAKRMAYRRPAQVVQAVPVREPAPDRPVPAIVAAPRLSHVFAYVEQHKDEMVRRSRERQITQHATGNAVRLERMARAEELGTHEQWEWWRLAYFYGGACAQCGSRERIHKDHIVPVSKGGSNGLENLQPLCMGCNLSKSDRTADYRWDGGEWVAVLRLGWLVGE